MCKKSIKNSHPFVKKMKNIRNPKGGIFFDSHCTLLSGCHPEVFICCLKVHANWMHTQKLKTLVHGINMNICVVKYA